MIARAHEPPPLPDQVTAQLSPPLTAFQLDAESHDVVGEVRLLAVRHNDTTLDTRFLVMPADGVCDVEWVPGILLVQGEDEARRVSALRSRGTPRGLLSPDARRDA